MIAKEGVLCIQTGQRSVPGRWVIYLARHAFHVGVIHACATLGADHDLVDQGLALSRKLREQYPDILWYFDSLQAEPRISRLARKPSVIAAKSFYADFLGIEDPMPANDVAQSVQEKDQTFLGLLNELNGAFTVETLMGKISTLQSYYADHLTRVSVPMEWNLAIHVQAGPSAGQTVNFFNNNRDAEAALGFLVEQLKSLAAGGHRKAPVTSRITLHGVPNRTAQAT